MDGLGVSADFQYVSRKKRNKKRRYRPKDDSVTTDQSPTNADEITQIEPNASYQSYESNEVNETESNDECAAETNDESDEHINEIVENMTDIYNNIKNNNSRIVTDAIPKVLANINIVEHSSNKPAHLKCEETKPEEDVIVFQTEDEVELNYNTRALSKHAETYELETFKKNALIIFNQENIVGYKPRYGTNKDVEALKLTFMRFGFEVIEHKDKTKAELFDSLLEFSTRDFTEYGCIGVAVLTHGSNFGLLRAKDHPYSEIEIINHFKVHDKLTLVTKPKFLVVQACRGTQIIPAAQALVASRVRRDVDASKEPYTLPVEADMLILQSSSTGCPSYRDEATGSWFIQSLCKKINERSAELDFESIFTEVKRDVAIKKEFFNYNRSTLEMQVEKQMPVLTSTLIRKLYLRKFGDPAMPIYTESDGTHSQCQNGSNDISDSVPPTPNMLVQFGPCSCFLEHYDYIKNCLRYFIEDNPTDEIALSYLEVADTFEEGVRFNAAKEKLAKAMCKHLNNNANNCQYYKYLYFYKHF